MPVETKATTAQDKILDFNVLCEHFQISRDGQRLVHCHGVFDLLHIGHVRYLERAKQMGDLLVVTVTPDRFVNKGPNRPAFGEMLRAEGVAALECVDFVAVNQWPTAVQTINRLHPDLYVKGAQYKEGNGDLTGGIVLEQQAVESVGGRLTFVDDITFSSSHLINHYMNTLPDPTRQYLAEFAQRFGSEQVLQYLKAARRLSVLVVGEAIIDEYQYCQAIGKSSKEPVLTVREGEQEKFAGGILAVGNQVAAFAGHTGLITVLGDQNPQIDFIQQHLNSKINASFLRQRNAPTIVKRRYIDSYFFQKLFEVYSINDMPLECEQDQQICETLEQRIDEYDMVIVVDYGHGMLSRRAADILTERSKFLTINAQCNAGNLGFHTVSKYARADLICVAENEIRVEARDRHGDLEPLVEKVSHKLGCSNVIITRGSHGCLAYGEQGFVHVPALANQVKDRMGAGDTFISLAALCVAQHAPIELAGLIGNAAGAVAVATIGHQRPVDRTALMKHVECLLK